MPQLRDPVVLVVAGGAIGGFISIMLPAMGAWPTVLPAHWWTFGAGTGIGAVASFVGVFLLFNTDRTDRPRLMAWAILLGLLWQPVIAASVALGQSLLNQQQTKDKIADASAKLSELEHRRPTTQASFDITVLGTELAVLIAQTRQLPDRAARAKFDQELAVLMRDYARMTSKDPSFARAAAPTLHKAQLLASANDLPLLTASLNENTQMVDVAARQPVGDSTKWVTISGPDMGAMAYVVSQFDDGEQFTGPSTRPTDFKVTVFPSTAPSGR